VLTKEQHIEFWKRQADDDWAAVDALFAIERYSQALFWAHLVLEKYSKAIWIRDNATNIPPKTHNLNHLLSQTTLALTDEQMEFLLEVNRFQIEGRYPEYITFMNELCNHDFTSEKITQINTFRICLLNNLL
jgi:HEPN domain-containing protein